MPKTCRVEIRLTDEEYERLKDNADGYGASVSEFIRRMCVYGSKDAPVIMDAQPFKDLFFEVHKQGVNLNQIARVVNTSGGKLLDEDIQDMLEHALERHDEAHELLIELINASRHVQ